MWTSKPRASNEAAVKAVARFRDDPWMEQVGNATSLDIDIRESSTKHSDPWQMPDTHAHTIRDMADKAIAAIKEHPLGK